MVGTPRRGVPTNVVCLGRTFKRSALKPSLQSLPIWGCSAGLMKMDVRAFQLRLSHKWAIASGRSRRFDAREIVLVRLSEGDVTGIGEAPSSSRYSQSADSIEEFLARVDPARLSFSDIPASMAYLEGLAPGHPSAKCAVNVALMDGAARLAGSGVM